MTDLVVIPLSYPFMQQAMIMGLLVAVPMGLLSCFLVLKGWSLMGDAVSHAVLPGIVLAYAAGIPLAVGAFAAGLACAVGSGWLKENSRIKEDTAMGVVFSGMFGLGIVLYLSIESELHLDHILFGDILGVSWRDVLSTSAVSAGALLLLGTRWRDLVATSFDEAHARTIGLGVRFLHYLLLATLSLTIVAALQSVGIILAVAFLIAPGATGFLAARRFGTMAWVAVSTAVLSTFTGILVSFHIDSAPAPTIVLVMTGCFLVAFFVDSRRGARSGAPTTR